MSAREAAELRAVEARQIKGHYAAQPVDGGVGQNSWSVNPAASGPWLKFRSGGRLVSVSNDTGGEGKLESVKAVAKTIDDLPGGIPAASAARRRPECERGTAGAERLLGAKATARRDSVDNGYVTCRWGTPTKAAFTVGGGPGSDVALDFGLVKDAGDGSPASTRRVAVGKEGWQQDDGFLAYRSGEGTFVSVGAFPTSPVKSAGILALARAILPAYSR